MSKHLLITESALDASLFSNSFEINEPLPISGGSLHRVDLSEKLIGYKVSSDRSEFYTALIAIECVEELLLQGASAQAVYQRIARVVKGMRSPPVHLPRQWREYHRRNLLAFFAVSQEISNYRWIVDIDGILRCARFDDLSSEDDAVLLANYTSTNWVDDLSIFISKLARHEVKDPEVILSEGIAQEIDLEAIGSAPVVNNRTFEEWQGILTPVQKKILDAEFEASIRIVGPAGSGKTLSLCLRALQISRDSEVRAQGKRVLIATHSWAMSERIDGIIYALNSGQPTSEITIYPLLPLLEEHAGHVGQRKTEVIGNDSTEGRTKSFDIIASVLPRELEKHHLSLSAWILDALRSPPGNRKQLDLVLNLYEEITGVLGASGVSPDDPESLQKYIKAPREEWMPPFYLISDRSFVVNIYRGFIRQLIDRGSITADQFILDSIRILETFAWRMRKETEGYDFILIDELQIFDPQERSAIELLGRSRRGVPFITAEDPTQGVFSALNGRRQIVENAPVYLETVHRFNREIFEFINFIYNQFPLNALPLKIDHDRDQSRSRPTLASFHNETDAISAGAELAERTYKRSSSSERLCVVTLGDVDVSLSEKLTQRGLQVTRLAGFDDVEQLAYRKRSIVVSPWQFIGGTQFSHVIVMVSGMAPPTSHFARLREMISVYLSCSRSARSLHVICDEYVPAMLTDAVEQGLLIQTPTQSSLL